MNAETVLKMQGWDLEKSIAWFYEHKDDDEYYKKCFETDNEDNTNIQGKSFVSYPQHSLKIWYVYYCQVTTFLDF